MKYSQLLSPGFLPDTLPALALVGTSSEVRAARAAGARVLRQEILASWAGADQASADAFGANPLSPSTRAPSARAGRAVGAAHAAGVAALWRSAGG